MVLYPAATAKKKTEKEANAIPPISERLFTMQLQALQINKTEIIIATVLIAYSKKALK
jgi:hypothetical protein